MRALPVHDCLSEPNHPDHSKPGTSRVTTDPSAPLLPNRDVTFPCEPSMIYRTLPLHSDSAGPIQSAADRALPRHSPPVATVPLLPRRTAPFQCRPLLVIPVPSEPFRTFSASPNSSPLLTSTARPPTARLAIAVRSAPLRSNAALPTTERRTTPRTVLPVTHPQDREESHGALGTRQPSVPC